MRVINNACTLTMVYNELICQTLYMNVYECLRNKRYAYCVLKNRYPKNSSQFVQLLHRHTQWMRHMIGETFLQLSQLKVF